MNSSNLQIPLILLTLAVAPATLAQTNYYSVNLVGYYNRGLLAGDNLIANQLGCGAGGQYSNTLDNVLIYNIPDGSTFTEWDAVGNTFLPLSIFNAALTNWSINYTLNLGQGGILHSPIAATTTFVGEVNGSIFNIDTGTYTWNPAYGPGYFLLSCPVPFATASFTQVVGRDPMDGEWVRLLDERTQNYGVTTYRSGLGWDNGDPTLSLGESAWFDLGPVEVPEPSASLLLSVAGALTALRKPRQNPAGKRRE
jgi:hypothetical protein